MLDPTCPSAHPHTFSYCSLPPAMSPFAHALDQPFLEDFGFESVHAAFRPSLSLPPLPNVRLFTGDPSHSLPLPADPAWAAWQGGFIPGLAQEMYDTRDFSRLPILGDAL